MAKEGKSRVCDDHEEGDGEQSGVAVTVVMVVTGLHRVERARSNAEVLGVDRGQNGENAHACCPG